MANSIEYIGIEELGLGIGLVDVGVGLSSGVGPGTGRRTLGLLVYDLSHIIATRFQANYKTRTSTQIYRYMQYVDLTMGQPIGTPARKSWVLLDKCLEGS